MYSCICLGQIEPSHQGNIEFSDKLAHRALFRLVRVFSDVLVAFLYLVANIKIWKSHLNTREGSDYVSTNP